MHLEDQGLDLIKVIYSSIPGNGPRLRRMANDLDLTNVQGHRPRCVNCVHLENSARQAVADLGIEATIEKVTDYPTIIGYGVISTPGLVVDEKLVLSGRVPKPAEQLLRRFGVRLLRLRLRLLLTPNLLEAARPGGRTRPPTAKGSQHPGPATASDGDATRARSCFDMHLS